MRSEAMKTGYKLALAVLGGVLIGGVGARAISAQQAKTPAGYIIAEIEVIDPAGLKEYAAKAPEIMASHGGHYVIRVGKVEVLEGEPPKGSIVVIGFDSLEKAREWYDSPDYKAIRGFRQSATHSRLLLAEGVAPQ
jgi:uncharacterized protein (DUF1330 family)